MAQAAGKQVHADEPAALQVGTNQKGRRRDGRRIQRVKRGRKTQACMVSGGCNASTCSRASKVRCDQMVVEVQCVLLSAQGGRLKPAHAMARDEAACRSAAAKRLAGRQAGRQAGSAETHDRRARQRLAARWRHRSGHDLQEGLKQRGGSPSAAAFRGCGAYCCSSTGQ